MTTDVTRNDGAGIAGGARRPDAGHVAEGVSGGSRDGVPAVGAARPGFLRRHRLPILLGVVALCLYAGSILYILYGRGQIA